MSDTAREAVRRLSVAAQTGELARVCVEAGVALMVLFGSGNREGSDPSDVDLGVRFERDRGRDVLGLLDRLYRLTGYEGFDVLDLGRAGPVARERALVGAQVLHESEAGLFANEQIAAIMGRLDTDEMRRVELELMAR